MNTANVKIGVALGGGFFRGIAHIGVLQVLEENRIPIHMMAGTSMGSVIGSIYVTGMNLNRLAQLALACNERMFFDIGVPRQGFIKGDKIISFMKTVTGDKTFEQTAIPFAAVACDIEKGEKVVIQQGKLYEAVRASISVPGIFVPYMKDGILMVDGGVLERVPSGIVRDMGADVVIAVDVGAREGSFKVTSTIEVMLRTFEIMEYTAVALGVPPDVVIAPKVRHINIMNMQQCEECIQLGRRAAEEMLPVILETIGKAAQRKAQPA